MTTAEDLSQARAGENGITIDVDGVTFAVDGVKHRLRYPKVKQLNELDREFWAISGKEGAAFDGLAEDDQDSRVKAMHEWRRDTGGYSVWYAMALRLLAEVEIVPDELPAWSVEGTQALVLISWWWKTPLALGVTPAK